MLALRKAQIEQTVQEEMTRLRVVESRLQQIDTYGQIQEPDVVLKAVPAQQFLALREVLSDLGVRGRLVRKIATIVPAKVGQGSLGNIAIVTHSPIFDPEALDLEVGYLLTGKAPQSVRLSEERVLTQHTLPAIETLATLAHAGRISEVHRSYGALGTWIEQHGWQINGLGRELLMQLPKSEEEEEVVIEIQMPVIRLDPSARSNRDASGH
jgi:effector-binding domain-containing protein